jgi:Flp pilus assembly secretin CpaC
MSVLSERCRRFFGASGLSVLLPLGTIHALPAQAQTQIISINLDQAHVFRLPERVATIVIGNPLIADATLQSGGILVVTGKGFGSTNLLALDRGGGVLMNSTVEVLGPGTNDIVVVYKGVERETYSCASNCERRITLGDSPAYFNANLAESGARNGQAQTVAPQR